MTDREKEILQTLPHCPACGRKPTVADYRTSSDETGEAEGYASVECTGRIGPEGEHFLGFHCETLEDAAAHWRAMFNRARA